MPLVLVCLPRKIKILYRGIMKILVTVGHNNKEKGAYAYDRKTQEYHYWKQVLRRVDIEGVEVASRDNGEDLELFYSIQDHYDLVIECHYNAYNGTIRGAECLVLEDASTYGWAMQFLIHMRVRGYKVRDVRFIDKDMRGHKNLTLMSERGDNAFIVEPFFGDNCEDYIPPDKMASLLIGYLESII